MTCFVFGMTKRNICTIRFTFDCIFFSNNIHCRVFIRRLRFGMM